METLCQVCKERPASAHLWESLEDGSTRALHICLHCIQELGLDLRENPPPIDAIVPPKTDPGSGLHQALSDEVKQGLHQQELACPHCGLSWSDYRTQKRLGCAHDYEVFRSRLEPLIQESHGNLQHRGRRPHEGQDERLRLKAARRTEMERRLKEAIAREDFEAAAIIRDELRRLSDIFDSHGDNPREEH